MRPALRKGHHILEEHRVAILDKKLRSLMSKAERPRGDDKRGRGQKWQQQHLQLLCSRSLLDDPHGRDGEVREAALDLDLMSSPWQHVLSDRELDILRHIIRKCSKDNFGDFSAKLPHKLVDLSQGVDRAGPRTAPSPCVTPGAKLWALHKARLVVGVERLALQALQFESAKTAQFSDDLLSRSQFETLCSVGAVRCFSDLICVAPM